MEVKRAELADKLETLESKIVGTVETAREAVAETVQTVKESVKESVETVTDTVQSSVETVRDTLDVRLQVERHPWAMVGGSIAAGFIAGWLVNRASRSAEPYSHPAPVSPSSSSAMPTRSQTPAPRFADTPPVTSGPPSKSWVDELSEHFAPELRKLKGLAIGAVIGVVRDMVGDSIPEPVRPKVNEIMDGITAKLGGEPLQHEVIEEILPHRRDDHHNGRRDVAETGFMP